MDAKLRDLVTEHLAGGCRHEYEEGKPKGRCIACGELSWSAVGTGFEEYSLEDLLRLAALNGIEMEMDTEIRRWGSVHVMVVWVSKDGEQYKVARSVSLLEIENAKCDVIQGDTLVATALLKAVGVEVEEG